jgi:hypothetical protein
LAQHAEPGIDVLPPAAARRLSDTEPVIDDAPAAAEAPPVDPDARADELPSNAMRRLPTRDSPSTVPSPPAAGAPQDPDSAADQHLLSAAEGLPPDHPLLARAQAALRAQLQATRLRLEQELSEKRKALKVHSP